MCQTLLIDFKQTTQNPLQYKNSFFVRTVAEWNTLDNEAVHAGSVNAFKAQIKKNI